MSVKTMDEAIDSLETIYSAYTTSGQALEDVEKIYKGGATPLMVEFPCIILKPDYEDRGTIRAAGRKAYARIENFIF